MPKKVLIICYYWPPAGGPGVQRWLKFVKYLPEFDVEPVVYVPENPSYPLLDESLKQEVLEGVTVLKRPIIEPYGWASALSRKQSKTISAGIIPKEGKQSLVQRALLYARGNFFIPDARVLWVKPSIQYLKEYIAETGIDTIVTSGPPHSLHLIGLGLKKSLGIRWIADFRDPWTTIGYHDKLKMTPKTQEKHRRLEKIVLHTCDEVLVTSPTTAETFRSITDTPIEVITNGYDDENIGETTVDTNFSISHIGSLLSDRNPRVLWEALAEIAHDYPQFKSLLRIKLAGKVSEEVVEAIHAAGLGGQLELLGYVSHSEALRLQREACVLLLIEIDAAITRGIIPGKFFEYLAAQRPILAIGPSGADVEEILTETKSGVYCLYLDKEKIKEFILNQFSITNESNTLRNEGAINKYHRKTLTRQLSAIILKK
ncbi:MAG: hypothetical protein ACI828_000607 [Flavobacteriales bacterium]|jgi:hypothetical protein